MNQEKNQNKNTDASGLHTYTSDLADALKDTEAKGGFVKKAISEAREKEEIKKELSWRSNKNLLFIVSGVILVIIGIALFSFALKKPQEKVVTEETQPIIFTDNTEVVDVSNLDREKIIQAIRGKIKKDGERIENFILVANGQILSKENFLNTIAPSAPKELASFVSDYLIGGWNGEVFILIKAGLPFDFKQNLKTWEEKMLDDLYLLFNIAYAKELFQTRVTDSFISNHPARVVLFNDQLVLGYLFLDNETLAIAASNEVFDKLDQKMIQKKIKK